MACARAMAFRLRISMIKTGNQNKNKQNSEENIEAHS